MSVSLIGQFGSSAFIFSVESGFQKPVAAIGTFRTSGHVGYSVAMEWKADIARIGRNRANDPYQTSAISNFCGVVLSYDEYATLARENVIRRRWTVTTRAATVVTVIVARRTGPGYVRTIVNQETELSYCAVAG
jgi:hypothetical protein